MKLNDAMELHFSYDYTYFISISSRYQFTKAETVYKLVYQYLHIHDKESRIRSVRELTQRTKEPHYHILYFSNYRLDYSKLHQYLKNKGLRHYDVRIEIVPKTIFDIKKVISYMQKQKR